MEKDDDEVGEIWNFLGLLVSKPNVLQLINVHFTSGIGAWTFWLRTFCPEICVNTFMATDCCVPGQGVWAKMSCIHWSLCHSQWCLSVLQVLGMDVDLTDEEQMLRAIALSLGENVVMSTDQVTAVGIYVSSSSWTRGLKLGFLGWWWWWFLQSIVNLVWNACCPA